MKKPILLLLSLLLLTACGGKTAVTDGAVAPTEPTEATVAPTEPPTENPYAPIGDENTFLLPALPDIGEYEADELDRWYDGPMPELIPSDEYGALYPYFGETREYSTYSELVNDVLTVKQDFFGLCTEDGTLVTDPIYTDIGFHDGKYLLSITYSDEDAVEYTRAFVAASDGSAVSEVYHGEGVVKYCAPDLYAVYNGLSVGFIVRAKEYLHSDGTPYLSHPQNANTEYENGFIIYYESGSKLRLLDKDLQQVGKYQYLCSGALGHAICSDLKRQVVLDSEFREVYSSEGFIRYVDGRYAVKSDKCTLTFFDESFNEAQSVVFPSDVHSLEHGYVVCRDGIYTLAGEHTGYKQLSYNEQDDALILISDDGTLISTPQVEIFIPEIFTNSVSVYGDYVVVYDGNSNRLFNSEGEYVGEVKDSDLYSYTTVEGERVVFPAPLTSLCSFVTEKGVLKTYLNEDGRLLVSIDHNENV